MMGWREIEGHELQSGRGVVNENCEAHAEGRRDRCVCGDTSR